MAGGLAGWRDGWMGEWLTGWVGGQKGKWLDGWAGDLVNGLLAGRVCQWQLFFDFRVHVFVSEAKASIKCCPGFLKDILYQ